MKFCCRHISTVRSEYVGAVSRKMDNWNCPIELLVLTKIKELDNYFENKF